MFVIGKNKEMKRILCYLLFCLTLVCNAQVGIGTNLPDASSVFEIASNTKGFLLPRLTDVQRSAINSPAQGLVIYNTTLTCVEFYRGTSWFNPCCEKLITRVETDTFYDIHFGYNTQSNLYTFTDFPNRTRADSGDVVDAVQNSVDTNIVFYTTLGTRPSAPRTPKNELEYRSVDPVNSFQAQGVLASKLIGGGNTIRSLYLDIVNDTDDFEIFMNAKIVDTSSAENYGCFFASTELGAGPSTAGSFQLGVGADGNSSGCYSNFYSVNIRLTGEGQDGLNCGKSTGNTKVIDENFHLFSMRNIKRSGAGSDLIWSIDGVVQDTIVGVTNTITADAFKIFSNRNESAGMEIEMSELYFSNDLFTDSEREILVHYYACKNSN